MTRWSKATNSLPTTIVPARQAPLPSQITKGYIFTAMYLYDPFHRHASLCGRQPHRLRCYTCECAASAKKVSISGKAAGVLIPLLFICLCVAAWFKIQRTKGKRKRKCWSEAVDKRMFLLSDLGELGLFVRVDDVGSAGKVEVALEPGD